MPVLLKQKEWGGRMKVWPGWRVARAYVRGRWGSGWLPRVGGERLAESGKEGGAGERLFEDRRGA